MRAVVVYESMFGSTRRAAEAVGLGLASVGEVKVVPVGEATEALSDGADLLVVGAPTHVHGMSRPRSRAAAKEMTKEEGAKLVLEPGAEGPGVREWLADLPHGEAPSAAFDTRLPFPFAGHASRGIARGLRRHGHPVLTPPKSFLVDKANVLEPIEEERARRWGEQLAAQLRSSRADAESARA